MQYYSYSEQNKELIGQGTAQLDPLESQKQGKDIFLLPQKATFTAPQKDKTGFAQVFTGSAWEYVVDKRGTKYWIDGDKWNTPARVMTELGSLPAGALLTPPQKTQEEINAELLQEAKLERAIAVQNIAVEVDGMIFDGNEDAQRRIAIALQTGDITGQQTTQWVLKNNTVATVTRKQLEQVLALSMQKMQELWTKPYTEIKEVKV